MSDISVVLCAHNPRPDYLRRVLCALDAQTLPKTDWELLVVDNASTDVLANAHDVSWHPRARHLREDALGLTAARLSGIGAAAGDLIAFVDDDNVLSTDYLEQAASIVDRFPELGAFGSGALEPEFEVLPAADVRPHLRLLAIRSVSTPRWTNQPGDAPSIPWGAGLCVRRSVADLYGRYIDQLQIAAILDRRGSELFSGGDDLFSWLAASQGLGFGIFPELRVTHLVARHRLERSYLLRLIHDHAFSSGVRHYMLTGAGPRRLGFYECVHAAVHGVRRGQFSMRCRWAAITGANRAARLVAERELQPLKFCDNRSLIQPFYGRRETVSSTS